MERNLIKLYSKRVFLWLILLIGTGVIGTFLFYAKNGPFPFGFPLPFYYPGGRTMIGTYRPSRFEWLPFLIDAVTWYIVSCVIIRKKGLRKGYYY
jgi:hypothetical protein